MKIRCQKSDLLESTQIALKAISSKTTLPILECFMIDVNQKITILSNDMELGIETIVKGTIVEKGSIAVQAKVFSEIIRKLPDSDVILETDENNTITITCEKSIFQICGKSSEDFPYLPSLAKNKYIVLSQLTLKELIYQTVFSISDNENNKMMTGELFEIINDELKTVSLDGHRISIRKIKLRENYDKTSVIIPGKTLNEISKILSNELKDEVKLYFTEKHVIFELENTTIITRLIDGEFYKIDQMLSNDYETKIKINKKEFFDCIDRATLMAKETEKKPIMIQVKQDVLSLKIDSSIGFMNEEIFIEKEGNDITIAFNPKFLLDVLKVIEDEFIHLYFFNPKAPCFIKNDTESYMYLILPVNFHPSVE